MPPLPLLKTSSLPADCSDHIRSLRVYALSAVTSSSSPATSSSSPATSSPAASSPVAFSAMAPFPETPASPAATPLIAPHSSLFPVVQDPSRQNSLDSQAQAWRQPKFQRTNQRLLYWDAARNGESPQNLRTSLLRTQSCAVLAACASASASASSPTCSGGSGVVARATSSGNELADVATAIARGRVTTGRFQSGVLEPQRVATGRVTTVGVTTGCSRTSSGSSMGLSCSSGASSAGDIVTCSSQICSATPLRTSSCPMDDNAAVANPTRSHSQGSSQSHGSSSGAVMSPAAATSRLVWRTKSIETGAEANALPALPASPLARAVPEESVFHWAARTRMARARVTTVPST
ncbi:hypothetical protein CLOM_g6710 [Closterium sp. NIES-68]|nr:hypothetical protein CLOM_g6710 [Closterium sp. NIES-68]